MTFTKDEKEIVIKALEVESQQYKHAVHSIWRHVTDSETRENLKDGIIIRERLLKSLKGERE